eukprot:33235-Prorocentrum_minimum.AAC.3
MFIDPRKYTYRTLKSVVRTASRTCLYFRGTGRNRRPDFTTKPGTPVNPRRSTLGGRVFHWSWPIGYSVIYCRCGGTRSSATLIAALGSKMNQLTGGEIIDLESDDDVIIIDDDDEDVVRVPPG